MPTNSLSTRHPHEVVLLGACLVTALPILAGVAPPPGSVTAAMTHASTLTWAGGIAVGALIAFAGIFWPRPKCPTKLTVTGLLLEQVGLVISGVSCLFYVAAVLWVIGWAGLFPCALPAGFAVANFILARRIQRLLRP